MRAEIESYQDNPTPPNTDNKQITNVPDNMQKWLEDNQKRIDNAKQLPPFVEQNKELIESKQGQLFKQVGISIEKRKEEYERYKNDPNYIDVELNPNNGGVKAIHKDHNLGSDPKLFLKNTTPNGQGLKGWELEAFCIEQLFEMGNVVIAQPEGRIKGVRNGSLVHYTALDLLLNGKHVDIKSITENKAYYTWALSNKNKQLAKWNYENPNDFADSVLLYFHDPSMFSKLKIKDGITHYLNNITKDGKRYYGHQNYLKHVYCVVRGVKRMYIFDVK